jgi:cell division control protein 6
MHILVLDEMDQVCKQAAPFVAELFALALLKQSHLIVIGIANRLDLAERMLRIFGTRSITGPKMIAFHSYNAKQLSDLLQVRSNFAGGVLLRIGQASC